MTAAVALGIGLAFAVGSLLQRVTGSGMGVVGAPVLTLLIGPLAGVTMTNAVAALAAAMVWAAMHEHVEWDRVVRIAPLIVVGSVAGAMLVRRLDTAWLDVLIGGTVLLALAGTPALARWHEILRGTTVAMTAGVATGLLNTAAGVAAPAMTAYGIATRWDQRGLAASLQPIWLVANVSSLAAKAALGAVPPAGAVPWCAWLVAAAGVVAGVVVGAAVHRRMPPALARRLMVVVAVAGSVLALGRGLMAL